MVTTPNPAPSENRNRSNKILFMLSFLQCCDFFSGSSLLFNQLFMTLCEICMVQNIFKIRCPVGVVYLLQDFPSRGTCLLIQFSVRVSVYGSGLVVNFKRSRSEPIKYAHLPLVFHSLRRLSTSLSANRI